MKKRELFQGLSCALAIVLCESFAFRSVAVAVGLRLKERASRAGENSLSKIHSITRALVTCVLELETFDQNEWLIGWHDFSRQDGCLGVRRGAQG